jgi:endonuclease YncB( thermonuclease family)
MRAMGAWYEQRWAAERRGAKRRPAKRARHEFVAMAALAAIALGIFLAQAPLSAGQDSAQAAGAYRVVDGDTIVANASGERIRIANIDAAETGKGARCEAERRHGEQASNSARRLIARAREVRTIPTGELDRYGRTLARVRVDGRDLGQILIDQGLARAWNGRREPWCGPHGELLL